MHASDAVYTEYRDARRDEFQTRVRRVLHRIPLRTWERETGMSRIILIDARKGRRTPHARHQRLLTAIARKLRLV